MKAPNLTRYYAVRLTQNQYAALLEIATAKKSERNPVVYVSDVVREFINAGLDREQPGWEKKGEEE